MDPISPPTSADAVQGKADLTNADRITKSDGDGSISETLIIDAVSGNTLTLTATNTAPRVLTLPDINVSISTYGATLVDDADAATARTTLGLGSISVQNTINDDDWSGTDLAVTNGGTGASTASVARTNLGLGTISTQDADSVTITGGTIKGTFQAIGNTVPSSGAGVELRYNGTALILGYNRDTASYLSMVFDAASHSFRTNNIERFKVSATVVDSMVDLDLNSNDIVGVEHIEMSGAFQQIIHDTGDYIEYQPGVNLWNWVIGSTGIMYLTASALTLNVDLDLNSNDIVGVGSLVVGTDPGGTEIFRAGGSARLAGPVVIANAGNADLVLESGGTQSWTIRTPESLNTLQFISDSTVYAEFGTDGNFIVGSDPGGTEIFRAGGAAKFISSAEIVGAGEQQLKLNNTTSGQAYLFRSTLGTGLYDLANSRFVFFNEISTNKTTLYGSDIELQGQVEVTSKLKLSGIPTSATGLSAGDVWIDGTTLRIV